MVSGLHRAEQAECSIDKSSHFISQAVILLQETLLGAEELAGDNQYRCDTCGCKRNATRQMRIRALPPHLCLSLQRFVFNMKVPYSAMMM